MKKGINVVRFAGRLTAAFLVLSMGSESLHTHEPSHGNRRERIEEARLRLEELQRLARASREIRGGGNPPPETPFHQLVLNEVRRRPEDDHVVRMV